jgi:hypothetical protein
MEAGIGIAVVGLGLICCVYIYCGRILFHATCDEAPFDSDSESPSRRQSYELLPSAAEATAPQATAPPMSDWMVIPLEDPRVD